MAGTPEQVRAALEALAREHDADELVIVTITHDPAARRRSYELVAHAFGIAGRIPGTPQVLPGA